MTPLQIERQTAEILKNQENDGSNLSFQPPLPFLKRDAIESVGFGLLNKVYVQFASPFWRTKAFLEPKYAQFGNASGLNPHHYMFLDVGKTLRPESASPAILMSLISGDSGVRSQY